MRRGAPQVRRRKAAEDILARLEISLADLGLPPASRRLRVALRARHYASKAVYNVIGLSNTFIALFWCDALITTVVRGEMWEPFKPFALGPIEAWDVLRSGHIDSVASTVAYPMLNAVAAVLIGLIIWVGPIVVAAGTAAGRSWSLSTSTRLATRFAAADAAAQAISVCVRVGRARWPNRPRELRRLASALARVNDELMRLHRTSGQLPARSHRRQYLRHHAGLVVAAIRRAHLRVDQEGEAALAPLAALLIAIAERVAEGRIGALLDADQLDTELGPARDWEPLRLASAALLVAATAVGVAYLPLPDGADVYIIGGCGIAILTLLYGRRVHQFLDLLNVIRGG